MSAPARWAGRVLIGPGWALFQGTAGDQARHRHHAVQVVIGVEGPVRLWAAKPGELSAPAAVIAADCAHRLPPGQAPMVLLYLERESAPGRLLDDWCDGGARTLSPRQARQLADLLASAERIEPATLAQVCRLVLGSAAAAPRRVFGDARIAQAIAGLPARLAHKPDAAGLAAEAGLSASRYAHLFRAHTGMPLRPYLRWLRLQQALGEIARGANLTDAAHAAGFADSAHLSRTFRQTFGIAPNVLLKPALALASAPAHAAQPERSSRGS